MERHQWLSQIFQRPGVPPDSPLDMQLCDVLKQLEGCRRVGRGRWTRDELLKALEAFLPRYKDHSKIFQHNQKCLVNIFAAWVMARLLKPAYIIVVCPWPKYPTMT